MLLLIGRRRKVIIFFIGISRHIQERISYLSIFFSDWLGVLALVSSFIASNMYCLAALSSPKGSILNRNRKNVLEYVSIHK